jgi:hypothetical protein
MKAEKMMSTPWLPIAMRALLALQVVISVRKIAPPGGTGRLMPLGRGMILNTSADRTQTTTKPFQTSSPR